MQCGTLFVRTVGDTGCTSTDNRRADYFDFNVTAGQYIVVQLTAIDATTLNGAELVLFPPSYDTTGDPPFVTGGLRQTIRYVATSNGLWEIGVFYGASSSGRYQLAVGCLANPTPGAKSSCVTQTLECNQTLTWDLDANSCVFGGTAARRYSYFNMTVDANRSASATLSAQFFNPDVLVYKNGGNPIYEGKGTANVSPAIGIVPIPSVVTDFQIAASAVSDSAFGTYTLKAACSCFLPTITQQPASSVLPAPNADITLSVVAAGDPPFHYAWYVGNSGDTTRPLAPDSPTLKLTNLTGPTQAWVRVSNACGHVDSSTAVISACEAPRITAQPKGGTIRSNEPFQLTVAAAGSTPLHYQWHVGQPPDGPPLGGDFPVLTFSTSTSQTLWVHVSNTCGAVDSDVVALNLPTPGHRRSARH